MTYNEIIQSPGKMVEWNVYYINSDNQKITIDKSDLEEAIIKKNAELVGTLMQALEITTKTKIESAKKIYLEVTATANNESITKTYGYYSVYSETYNANDKTYDYVCYDSMLDTMVDYKPLSLTYPTTIQNYFNKLIETVGFTTNVSLINGSLEMSSDIYNNINFTYRSVIQDIAQANGVLLYADGTEIKAASLGSDVDKITITDDILKNTNIDFGEHYGPINTIVVSRSADSDSIYYPESLPENPIEFKISDNQLMNDNTRSQFLPGIYQKLNGIEYDIFDTELVGYGDINPLQKVLFQTGSNTYTGYVFNYEIKLSDGYEEVIYADLPDEAVTDYTVADSTDNKVRQAYIIVNKQLQEIESKIETIADVTTEAKGTGVLNIKNILSNKIIYLSVHPTTKDIVPLLASTSITVSKTLKAYSRGINFVGDNSSVIYNLPTNLYQLNGVYDEFIQDNVEEKCYVIHRIGINEDGSKYELEEETTEEFTDYEPIELETSSQYKVYCQSYLSAYVDIKAMVQNDFTSQFATKIDLSSTIKQTQESITSEVKREYTTKDQTKTLIKQTSDEINQSVDDKLTGVHGEIALKVGKDENDQVVSMLNASADLINLKSNRLVVDSTQFKLDKSGNATFSGNLSAASGTFTGKMSVETTGSSAGAPIACKQTMDDGNVKTSYLSGQRLTMYKNGGAKVSIGYSSYDTGGNINLYDSNSTRRIAINGDNITNVGPGIRVFDEDGSTARVSLLWYSDGASLNMPGGTIYCKKVSESSLEELKKNFELYTNALEEIKKIDIYKYNFKDEPDDTKKHLGFVIGDKYNYSDLVTSLDLEGKEYGVDNYAFTSLCLQAIKEQQKEIEELKEKIESMEATK